MTYNKDWVAKKLEADPNYHRRLHLKKKFKMTLEEFDRLVEAQNGVCVICGGVNKDRRLAVDHDRSCCPDQLKTCGECIRGLLCSNCNNGIGRFMESPELLSKAAEYLKSRRVKIK